MAMITILPALSISMRAICTPAAATPLTALVTSILLPKCGRRAGHGSYRPLIGSDRLSPGKVRRGCKFSVHRHFFRTTAHYGALFYKSILNRFDPSYAKCAVVRRGHVFPHHRVPRQSLSSRFH